MTLKIKRAKVIENTRTHFLLGRMIKLSIEGKNSRVRPPEDHHLIAWVN